MAHYLLVLHDLDESRELVATARDLASSDAAADFVLLVPAVALAPFEAFLLPYASSIQRARERAQRVRAHLLAVGLRLVATRLGNSSPLRALDDALRFGTYAAVVIASPPHTMLHDLHRDFACRAVKRFPGTRVLHAADGGFRSSYRAGVLADSSSPPGVWPRLQASMVITQ
jgi:hypothetical protein